MYKVRFFVISIVIHIIIILIFYNKVNKKDKENILVFRQAIPINVEYIKKESKTSKGKKKVIHKISKNNNKKLFNNRLGLKKLVNIPEDSSFVNDMQVSKNQNINTKKEDSLFVDLSNSKREINSVEKDFNKVIEEYKIFIPQPSYPFVAKELGKEAKIKVKIIYKNSKIDFEYSGEKRYGFYEEIAKVIKQIKVTPPPKDSIVIEKEFIFKIKDPY